MPWRDSDGTWWDKLLLESCWNLGDTGSRLLWESRSWSWSITETRHRTKVSKAYLCFSIRVLKNMYNSKKGGTNGPKRLNIFSKLQYLCWVLHVWVTNNLRWETFGDWDPSTCRPSSNPWCPLCSRQSAPSEQLQDATSTWAWGKVAIKWNEETYPLIIKRGNWKIIYTYGP